MKIIKTDQHEEVSKFRKAFYQHLTAPIDAMWEQLYIASAQPYLITEGNQNIGYCCIDSDKRLLQLFVIQSFRQQMQQVIKRLIDSELVISASLSSSDPVSFNACLFHSKSISTNTFCFEHGNESVEFESRLNLELVSEEEIPMIKAFLKQEVGMDDTFGYTENLVNRKEIYRAKDGDTIIATSECRISDSQVAYADLGMIVNSAYRGRGFATEILKYQTNRVLNLGRKPICSTTIDNLASQKAIKKAGFYCSNIIFDIQFDSQS